MKSVDYKLLGPCPACTGSKAGHSLCPLERCEEGELCPHARHIALRMEDGIGKDALNIWEGRRQWMEWDRPRQ